MSVDDDIKLAELELKKIEIQKAQKELASGRRFTLASAAVAVTVLGGLAAVLFQAIGLVTALNDKARAETDKATAEVAAESEKQAAKVAAQSDFDFKGLELFLQEQERIVTCDPDVSAANLKLFKNLFSATVTDQFTAIIEVRYHQCVTQTTNAAADTAKAEAKTPDEVATASDAARYTAAETQTALLAQAPVVPPTPSPAQKKFRVFIQINSEADRSAALALQTALNQAGYTAPGVELVASGPKTFQVRYYRAADKDDAAALVVASKNVLHLDPNDPNAVSVVSLGEKYRSLPSATMEFWFPRRS